MQNLFIKYIQQNQVSKCITYNYVSSTNTCILKNYNKKMYDKCIKYIKQLSDDIMLFYDIG